jgi:two-component system sensor histidine kinase/response regulator
LQHTPDRTQENEDSRMNIADLPAVPRFVARRRWWLLPLLVWGLVVAYSLHDHLDDIRQQSIAVATEGARNMFRMIVLTRAWNAEHGGLYVPVGDKIQPNPYLEHPRRDLVTADGQALTMVNPAFMTRLISELARRQSGTVFHITSLKPIRPSNAPDEWETRALQGFESGGRETVDIVTTEERRELRYMAPLLVEKPCMACHEKQGYRIGDVRGGISVNLPFEPVEAAMLPARRQAMLSYLGMFLLVALLGGGLLEILRRRWLNLGETITDLETARRDLVVSNQALQEARDAADAANVAKSSFLANMSHEIRTPMNAIMGMAHLTLRTELTQGQRNYLQKIQGASQHLLGVINDILDFSKIEAGKLEIEQREFDLDELFDTVASQLGERVASKELELVIDIDPEVPRLLVGDALRLGQVLLNLGGNAAKFTERGEIDIVVRSAGASDGAITISFAVSDTGIGLTEEQRSRLFRSFEQADNTITRKYGGTGLGLAISQRIVTLMGGQIDVVSTPGVGSTFSFSARFGIGTGQRRRVPTPDLRGRRLLVVDDNENAREVMGTLLRSMSFIVTETDSGAAALAALQRGTASGEPYEIVFLDWQMPGMDGITVARHIRTLALTPAPIMIMVTAYGRDDLISQAQDAGIADIFPKPVTASTLFDSVMNVLGKRDGQSLPCLAEAGRAAAANSHLAAIAGARVLLVEDNALNQEVATALLEDVGLVVDVAENGAVALDKLVVGAYDLVLMDMQMPVMDGVNATRAIRRQPQHDTLPIVAMTANALSGDREICLQAGMNDHLAKPIDPARLLDTLLRWIKPGRHAVPVRTAQAEAVEPVEGNREAQDTIAALRRVNGLDITTGLRLARGREKLYISLLKKYADAQRDFVKYLDAALAERDWETAVRLAHTLKGVSGQIGALTVRPMAELIEQALQQHEGPAVIDSLKGQIGEVLDELIPAIEAQLPQDGPMLPAAAAVAVDEQQLRAVCQELHGLLGSADYKANILLERHAALLQAGLGTDFEKLAAAVSAFDFDVAAERLDTMLRCRWPAA